MDGPIKNCREITDIPVIDAHMHVFPDKLYRAVRNWFETNGWRFEEDGTATDFIARQLDWGTAGIFCMTTRPGCSISSNR